MCNSCMLWHSYPPTLQKHSKGGESTFCVGHTNLLWMKNTLGTWDWRKTIALLERVQISMSFEKHCCWFTGMLSLRDSHWRTTGNHVFPDWQPRETFPNLYFGKAEMFFYSNSSGKTLAMNSTFSFPYGLMGCESEIKLEAQDKGKNLTSKGPFSKVAYKAHLTQNQHLPLTMQK